MDFVVFPPKCLKLGFLSFNIQATDGTLFPSAARYPGCCHFNNSCASITVYNVVQKVRDRVLYRIQNSAQIVSSKECRVRTECPNARFPEDSKLPKITILSFSLENASEELSAIDSKYLKFFRIEEPLIKLGLVLRFRESNIHEILVSSFLRKTPDSVRFRCPKLPYDQDARMGVWRLPSKPDKTEKIFGYKAIIATWIEHHLGIELPVGCITIAGKARKRILSRLCTNKSANSIPSIPKFICSMPNTMSFITTNLPASTELFL